MKPDEAEAAAGAAPQEAKVREEELGEVKDLQEEMK